MKTLRGICFLLVFMLLNVGVVSASSGVEPVQTKLEIDKLLENNLNIYSKLEKTEQGAVIYTTDDIKNLDKSMHKIILLQEQLRRTKEKTMDKYLDITYPLVSEIEHYGIRGDYTESFYTDDFFDKKDNKEYENIIVDYDFFKDIPLSEFKKAVDLVNFVPLDNLQILFNPYKLLSSYAYCETYTPDDMNIRRARIYFIPNDGEDIVSTFYHELGHMVFDELVKNDETMYNEYYKIYQSEFDKNNAKDNYGRWDLKLTENFAEDFKIYAVERIIKDNEGNKNISYLQSLIAKNTKSFYGKTTVYEVKNNKIFEYFNKLLNKYNVNTVKTNLLRPNIKLFLEDYVNSFNYKDSTYTNQYINKIVTKSDETAIFLDGFDYSEMELKNIRVYELEKISGKIKSEIKSEKIAENLFKVKTNKTDIDYQIDILIIDIETGYEEIITYYLFK